MESRSAVASWLIESVVVWPGASSEDVLMVTIVIRLIRATEDQDGYYSTFLGYLFEGEVMGLECNLRGVGGFGEPVRPNVENPILIIGVVSVQGRGQEKRYM